MIFSFEPICRNFDFIFDVLTFALGNRFLKFEFVFERRKFFAEVRLGFLTMSSSSIPKSKQSWSNSSSAEKSIKFRFSRRKRFSCRLYWTIDRFLWRVNFVSLRSSASGRKEEILSIRSDRKIKLIDFETKNEFYLIVGRKWKKFCSRKNSSDR